MPDTVQLRRVESDLWEIAPPGAPSVLDPAPALDTLVLEVVGGHLSWSLLSGSRVPAAVLHDLDAAQDWLWAVYGEPVAVAAASVAPPGAGDGPPVTLTAEPARPGILRAAWRLAYAHWAARWWPASTVDGIPALDQRLLDEEITTLTDDCDLLVDGADAQPPVHEPTPVPVTARAEDYALAAGAATGDPGGALTFGRGSGGWDWRRCPPGLLDASEHAVSWELTRAAGRTLVRVRAVAAPGLSGAVPVHLRPHARVDTGHEAVDIALELVGDTWSGSADTDAETVSSVRVYVPGVGPAIDDESGSVARERIRAFARNRLHRAAPAADDDRPLRAELAAAAEDTDF
ncbi:hypothetical protein [Nocardia farcinica]|uniref:hypothetical protein n=1 Tax=Nocardia farcinica TaxID=37329 RepID=UPI002458A2F5|nr:hypothetical protein [Nocardia farcinica]